MVLLALLLFTEKVVLSYLLGIEYLVVQTYIWEFLKTYMKSKVVCLSDIQLKVLVTAD